MKTKLTCMITLALAIAASAHAGSATWSLKPTSGDWNTAENWDPATVPNGSSDIATFAVSNTTDLSFSTSAIEVSSIIFNPGASSFNITLDPDAAQSAVTLTISGAGIVNNSGDIQNLTVAPTDTNGQGLIQFLNSASAGEDTVLTLSGSERTFFKGGGLNFYDTASAGSASISVGGESALTVTSHTAPMSISTTLRRPRMPFLRSEERWLRMARAAPSISTIPPAPAMPISSSRARART